MKLLANITTRSIMHEAAACIRLCSVLFLLSGCAPQFGDTLSISKIPLTPINALENGRLKSSRVRVVEFEDSRPQHWIGTVNDGRKLNPQGKVGTQVQIAFERQLRQNRIPISLFDGNTLTGQVKEWQVDITVGFPSSKLDSMAELEVAVISPAGRLLYSGVYRGQASEVNPLIENKVDQVLGEAMGMAVNAALSDKALLEALAL